MTLASPSLPIGGFAYSEGLEGAVHLGWVNDAASASDWILGRLEAGLARAELPLLARLHDAFARDDEAAVVRWSELARALRETHELREADRQLGEALTRLLRALSVPRAEHLAHAPWLGVLPAFALAALSWRSGVSQMLVAYATAWADAQVSAAVKLVPLGQSDGQRIMLAIAERLDAQVALALACADDALGATTPGVAFASVHHEQQYARLFRS